MTQENSTPKKRFIKHLIIFWSLFTLFISGLSLFFYGIASGWFGFMPSFEELENPKSNIATEIISADNNILGKFYVENRSTIKYHHLSPYLVDALISTEDVRFRDHTGIDWQSLGRVGYGVISGQHKGGGSTITQQLAKNLFPREAGLSKKDLILRKFKEWVTAIKLERNYTKDEIIAMYFNTVDFGSNSFGIKAASKTFFNCSPDSLQPQEAAMMVGMLKAPTWYSPIRNPERAIIRRNVVLAQMNKYHRLTQAQYDSLSSLPLDMSKYKVSNHTTGLATYFREFLRKTISASAPVREKFQNYHSYQKDSTHWVNDALYGWLEKHPRPDGTTYNIYRDGLTFYTTIDSRLQQYAEEAVNNHLGKDLQPAFFKEWKGYSNAPFLFQDGNPKEQINTLLHQAMIRSERYRNIRHQHISKDSISKVFNTPVNMRVFTWAGEKDTLLSPLDSIRYYKHFLHTGLMSVESHTGYVKAYVGGVNYSHFQYDHVTQGRRQVGSTFKPFLYTLAMQEGEFSPCSKIPNIQYSIDLPNGDKWAPRNDSKRHIGELVTLKWALAQSNNWISAYLMKRYGPLSVIKIARKMGVSSDIPAVPAIALGSSDLSLYEMVGAMNTFANKGVHIQPLFVTRITDKDGNTLDNFIPQKNEAMSEETAYLMLKLMQGVVESGTGIRLRLKYQMNNPIAGKTGTTQNNSDGWFMGLTPDLVTGVWTGCEDRSAHFRSIRLGQGANMALPIWALYMQKAYADSTLNISQADFDPPANDLSVEVDCDKYEQQQKQKQNLFNHNNDF